MPRISYNYYAYICERNNGHFYSSNHFIRKCIDWAIGKRKTGTNRNCVSNYKAKLWLFIEVRKKNCKSKLKPHQICQVARSRLWQRRVPFGHEKTIKQWPKYYNNNNNHKNVREQRSNDYLIIFFFSCNAFYFVYLLFILCYALFGLSRLSVIV